MERWLFLNYVKLVFIAIAVTYFGRKLVEVTENTGARVRH